MNANTTLSRRIVLCTLYILTQNGTVVILIIRSPDRIVGSDIVIVIVQSIGRNIYNNVIIHYTIDTQLKV